MGNTSISFILRGAVADKMTLSKGEQEFMSKSGIGEVERVFEA